jgi:hypothetical protein
LNRQVVAIAGLAALIGIALGVSTLPSAEWLLVGAGATLALFPLCVAMIQRRLDIFEPVHLFAFSYLTLFVVRPIFDLAQTEGPQNWLGYSVRQTYDTALLIGIAGAVAFYIGYYIRLGPAVARRVPVPQGRWSASTLGLYSLLAIVASLGIYGVFIGLHGGVHFIGALLSGRNATVSAAFLDSSGYLYDAPLWTMPLGIFLLARTPRWVSAKGLLAFGIVVYSQLPAIAGGDRSWTVPVLAAIILVYYLRRGRRPSGVTTCVVLILVLLFGISLPREFRNTLDRQATLDQLVVATATHPWEAIGQLFLGADTAVVDDLAIEVEFVPSNIPYQRGATYVEALARPVPRTIWPTKPPAAETLLVSQIWPQLGPQLGYSFSLFGEPYLNLGFAGVFLVTLLFAALWRAAYEWFKSAQGNVIVMTLYAISLPFLLVYARGGIGVDYQRQIICVALLLVAIPVALIRTHEKKPSSSMPRAWAPAALPEQSN